MEGVKLLFEDFKHPNFNIRICRVQHLDSLIELLNKEQLNEQLLPFLLDVIINLETNEEVLVEYSHHLKELFFRLSNKAQISKTSLKLLFWLNNHEDDQIRKVTFNCFRDIMVQYNSNSFIEEELLPLLNESSPRKIGNCSLIPLLFSTATSTNIRSILLNSFIEYCRDDNVYIRRQAANNLKHFLNEGNQFIMNISNEFFRLLSDPSELVKVSIIEASGYMIKILSAEKQKELINNKLVGLLNHEKAWKIKVALSNLICSVCYCFDQQFNEDYFLSFLIQTLKDNEVEVRLNTLTNLQIYLNCITEKTIREKVVPLLANELYNDSNWNIRAANAVMLLRLKCQIVWDEGYSNSFYPLLSKFIKDDQFEAKHYFITKISSVFKESKNQSSPIENIIHDYYYPIIAEIIHCNNWRLRYEIEKSFLEMLSLHEGWINEKNTVLQYVYLFFTDNANEIRRSSLVIIESLLKVDASLISDIWQMQVVILDSNNYLLRIFSLKSIIQLLPKYEASLIDDEVIPAILNKLDDNNSNVRLYSWEAIKFIISNDTYNTLANSIKSKIRNMSIFKYEDMKLKISQLIN